MEKKLTKTQMFEVIKGICKDNAEIVEFCTHEQELLAKKNSKATMNKNQVANAGIKETILAELADIAKPVTISELQAQSPKMAEFTNQKLSALLKQLVESGQVVKTTNKKKSFFSVA